jgi:hypothetical protein
MCTQLVEHPVLEGFVIQFRARRQLTPSCQLIHHPHVSKVKFGCADDPPLGTPGIGRQPATKQGVFEDLEIALDGMTGNTTVACNGREVDQLGVREHRHIEELGEDR